MKISKKLKIKILAMFAVFIFSALLGVYLFWKSTLPVYDGRLHLIGLKHPVIVRRDSWGIPHIEAQTEQDVFMAMGYVVAQDRFWQMEFMRRLMTGRLSEMAGSSTLPLDRLMRIVGIKQQVEKEVSDLAPSDRTLIRAYCQGVNQFIESGRLPVECYIFGIEPQPWTEADVLLIPKLLAFWLTWWQTDVFLGAIQSHIDEERFHELMPYYPGDAPSIIPADSLDRLQSARRPEKHDFSATVDPRVLAGLAMFNDLMGRGTSNSWVISGEKTTSGKPLLANDPHLILALPSNFYEIHLLTPQLDVYGQTVPGAPGVVIGHNRAISWGLTNGMLDDADLFIEKINPDNSDEYLDGQLWRPVEVRPETILVKGEKPVVLEVKKTRHGPIISGELENTSQVLSFSWMGYRQGQEIGSILACGYAADWADFRAAVSAMTCPALNLVYADTSGNIGYQFCGKIPLRRNGIGRFPHPAWSGAYDWIGVVPFEENPNIFNPRPGYIATANNQVQTDYEHYINNQWEPSDRIRQIHARLQEQDIFSAEDLAAIQVDTYSIRAAEIVPQILDCYSLEEPTYYLELVMLGRWDYDLGQYSEAATLYQLTYDQLLKEIFADEMGQAFLEQFAKVWNYANTSLDNLLTKDESPWFDDISTPAIETKTDILQRAFETAVKEWRTLKFNERHWGYQHRITFKHVLGMAAPFKWFVNSGPHPLGGDGKTVWKAEYAMLKRPFESNVGPNFRKLDNLADLSQCMAVFAGGQSGHWFQEHYTDQIPLWLDGAMRPCLFSGEQIEDDAIHVLTLLP